ncbi:putative HTH-type transcriptional regulator YwoH [Thalassobacillus devorans]|uniref:HTH-type transcriptional regulator YwoH n=1 Tax=Thalassobacillus devorans TaxID=279813 RepID=A0ABQ1PJB8_9BACI|nr:MarR family transcriptional regulator [Thalassobacillus devorans]NIK30081.1 DNA-binding MarR family transcriptional regulator [Thalassobacillus devorans]GGC98207.1 putative HTH-type transcriptional regulator YwoH [Thalassobacillus devorans]
MINTETRELFHLLNQRVRLITKEVNNVLSDHGLYHSQWSIIFCLDQFGPMTQTAIWKYLNVEAPTVTRTLSRMEKNGWIIRKQGEDKRERVIEMTDAAKQKFTAVNEAVDQIEKEMAHPLSSEEIQHLKHLLRKLGATEGE